METDATRINSGLTTAMRIGLAPEVRALIVNADDFGLCRDENQATVEGLERGIFTSATILAPAPGFDEAAAFARRSPAADLGVHLTLNSEWPDYRWAPVLGREAVPSLVDAAGFLWPDVAAVYAHVRLDEAQAELRAQIEKVIAAGIDPTHLDCHMGPLHLRADFHELYVHLARDYRLPIRVTPRAMLRRMGLGAIIEQLDTAGILYPDNFIVNGRRSPENAAEYWRGVIRTLPPGISEIYCHPAYAGAELRGFAHDAAKREADFRFFTGADVRELIALEGIQLIGYRKLRALMRGEKRPG
ncbi:MAG TPA: polysaccharide deacetylase family protein [Candidatus Binataceae bacterium]|nr:polysaccharide deacetylase family protein [Candidatus Binataceae bacterium]